MEKFKRYMERNFEQVFVLVILIAVFYINYVIAQKVAFLNFYFLPIILAGYYLGMRRTVLGAVLCILLISIYALVAPKLFLTPANNFDLVIFISSWGGFLILAGGVVAKQRDRLNQKIEQARILNEQLAQQKEDLDEANKSLKDYSENLESKVAKRTEELEMSRDAIEKLKDKVENTLYSTMDSSVVKLIIEGRLASEKRRVSVLFSDLVSFTEYSEERSPELVVRDLNRYLKDIEPILFAYRGHIDKYMGDGVMAEFGAPIDFEQYRLLSVLAALKMQQKMTQLNFPWKMRIGIASGLTIMGLIGSRRQSYTSIGDVVNLASRLEKASPSGAILIDSSTMDGVRNFMEVRLKKMLPQSDDASREKEADIEDLIQMLNKSVNDVDRAQNYYKLGKIHSSLEEYYDAIGYFEMAMQILPDNVDLKVAFAEASVKKDENEKMSIKGRKKRVAAYEVIGLKDILLDRNKIPIAFYNNYGNVREHISIPDDVILPIEALDGCIGHSTVVSLLSYAIAAELGLYEQEMLEIMKAGFLADIGKEIIPHHLLNRSDTSLSDSELAEVKKHPAESTRIIRNMGYDSELVMSIVGHSHENYDGSGYPDRLAGDQIPVGSRIVAVADAYDALTSWRSYHERWDRNAAFDELNRGVEQGIFDPGVVSTLARLLT